MLKTIRIERNNNQYSILSYIWYTKSLKKRFKNAESIEDLKNHFKSVDTIFSNTKS